MYSSTGTENVPHKKGKNKMTIQEANKIKKILKKENAVFINAGYYDSGKQELRVKVVQFVERSNFTDHQDLIVRYTSEQKEAKARENIIKVLRALSKNGLRPEYRTEQRETSDCYGTFDSRYVIFK
jgi:hypothetical protein